MALDFMDPFIDKDSKAGLAKRQGIGSVPLSLCTDSELTRALSIYQRVVNGIEAELKKRAQAKE